MKPRLRDPAVLGALSAGGAFLFWGLAPIYWKALAAVPASQLLAHRIAWSLPLLLLLVSVRRRWPELGAALRRPRTALALLASTALIGANWFTFIWAVNSGRVLEASLGYYVNPLVNVLLGALFLGERLRRGQWIALTLAAAGVALLAWRHGQLPWVALLLAGSFALYGLLRKVVQAGPIVGLTVEVVLLSPLALGWLVAAERSGAGAFGHGPASETGLLLLAGAVTVTPLLLFTQGARRLTLTTLGFLQYLAPTGQLVLAVAVYHEPFGGARLAAFALIWCGLAIYSAEARRHYRASRTPAPAAVV